jgi:hypothetical protein
MTAPPILLLRIRELWMQMLKLIGSFSGDSKETGYKQMHFRGKLASRLGDLPGLWQLAGRLVGCAKMLRDSKDLAWTES